jgi:hypothetical protein
LTSSGSAYSRFQRALATGNIALVTTAAAELPRVSLADALEVCLVFRDDPERYARAAVRWHGRLCLEARGMTATDAQLALSCLQALPARSGKAAAGTLAEICRSYGLSDAAAVLDRSGAATA